MRGAVTLGGNTEPPVTAEPPPPPPLMLPLLLAELVDAAPPVFAFAVAELVTADPPLPTALDELLVVPEPVAVPLMPVVEGPELTWVAPTEPVEAEPLVTAVASAAVVTCMALVADPAGEQAMAMALRNGMALSGEIAYLQLEPNMNRQSEGKLRRWQADSPARTGETFTENKCYGEHQVCLVALAQFSQASPSADPWQHAAVLTDPCGLLSCLRSAARQRAFRAGRERPPREPATRLGLRVALAVSISERRGEVVARVEKRAT